MDDPWGSPWATNDSSTNLEPFPRASITLEPPGRTLTRNRSFSTQSPWAASEDDGFADWTTGDSGLALPPAAVSPSPGWSAWGGENGLNTSQTHLASRAREGSLGQPSPTLWPTATSPGLQPTKTISRRSSARSLFRQPSPDPWATEFSQNRLSLPAAVHNSTDQPSFSALERHEEEPEQQDPETNEHVKPEAPGHVAQTAEPSTGEAGSPKDLVIDRDTTHTAADEECEARGRGAENNTNSPTLSRHSSLSEDSQHGDRPPESPITSMDEDTKDRPAMTRRSSAKVQELVHLYDGLAKKKDQTLLTPDLTGGRQRSASRSMSIQSGKTDFASDFGDFENAQDEESSRPSKQSSISGSPRRPSSRAGRLRSLSKTSLSASAAVLTQPVPSPILEEVSSKLNDLRERFGPVKFDVNLGSVDQLFDVKRLDQEQPSVKDYSLDAIDGVIKDSFTTVSERKTWYRISRPGTLRKHDMGDDENYRRVTWAGSKVRDDVTKTVRRWMEEDSYNGRPVIGGGSTIKSGGFNWDAKSKAEPLSFDQIFGKRKSVQPLQSTAASLPRPLSLQPEPKVSGHSRNSSIGVKSLPPRSPLSIPEPPSGPAFGWSTGMNDTPTPASSRPSSQYVRQSLDVNSVRSGPSRTTSMHEPESRSSIQLAVPPSAPTLVSSVGASNLPALAIADDEDEEWGDMVASPAVESRPASILFDNSFNGSMSSLHAQFAEAPVPKLDAATTLRAVTSKLEETQGLSKEGPAASVAPLDIWDFSAFDSKLSAPAIPPTITSKPEFDFDTPLQSPTLSVPSRTGSPSSFPFSKPTTSTSPVRAGSPSSLQQPKPPTPSVPFRPQHGQHRSKSSLNLVRPSPLHNVITPKAVSPALSPAPATPIVAETRTVSFAPDEDELSTEDAAIVRQIVGGLPDLSYMLR